MVKLTPELIEDARIFVNPCQDRELDLRGFKIPAVESLGATYNQFDNIDFTDNDLRRLENFPNLLRLKSLFLSNNRIAFIDPTIGPAIKNLHTLVLTNNNMQELGDLDALTTLPKLEYLSLMGNPVSHKPNYRLYLIHKLPKLRVLDYRRIRQKVPVLDALTTLPKLEYLSLMGNPVSHKPNYRLYLIHKLPKLRVLDYRRIRQKVPVLDALTTLPKLEYLILMGNPVCHKPNYRLYLIHKLPKLRVLDYRRIRQKVPVLDALTTLPKLEYLSLMGNPVSHKPNCRLYLIHKLPKLRVLDYRRIRQKVPVLDALTTLPKLEYLSLMGNPVSHKPNYRLYLIHKLPKLRVLDYRRIRQKVPVLDALTTLPKLEYLILMGNPVCHKPNYRLYLIHKLPKLRVLDYRRIRQKVPVLDALTTLPKLEYLSLMGNPVSHKPNYRLYLIHKLPKLRVLDYRRIRQKVPVLDALTTLPKLEYLILMGNPVCHKPNYRLYLIHKLPKLRVLDYRRIRQKVPVLDALTTLPKLEYLILMGNPVCHKPNYRLYLIHKLPKLRVLDYRRIRQKVPVLDALTTLPKLEYLSLMGNPVSHKPNCRLYLIHKLPKLRVLDYRRIRQKVPVLDALTTLPKLEYLSLMGNPVSHKPNYRLYLIHKLPKLRVLDYQRIRQEERESAKALFKGKKGKALAAEMGKRSKAAAAAAASEKAPTPQGGADVQKIKAAIEGASSLAEVEALQEMLAQGQLPSDSNGRAASQNGEEEEEMEADE